MHNTTASLDAGTPVARTAYGTYTTDAAVSREGLRFHVVDHHPENGTLLGFWLYLMSDCLVFACLFAAYGVLGSLAIAWWSGGLTRETFWQSLMGATRLSCMIMFILAGAAFLSPCMAFTGIPRALAEWVAALQPNPYMLIAVLAGIYILLGTALDGVSMIVLTTSIVIPMIEKAGFDLVWFGIFIVLVVEMAQITPPVGFNLFVIQGLTKREITWIARVSMPLFWLMCAFVLFVYFVPGTVTWLPGLMQ